VLRVDDDGPGVPADARDAVFEPFTRVNGTDRPGSGLGLTLVAQQARHHGATIAVGDAPLGGARFTVWFA
jgi:signal transduction histidine kinase